MKSNHLASVNIMLPTSKNIFYSRIRYHVTNYLSLSRTVSLISFRLTSLSHNKAVAAVYKLNKTKKRFLTILNANLEENSVILTTGERNYCARFDVFRRKLNKAVINAVKPNGNSKLVT